MKKQITFEEFKKLPRKEQNVRYKDLSDRDKFLARLSDVGQDNAEGLELISKIWLKRLLKLGIEER